MTLQDDLDLAVRGVAGPKTQGLDPDGRWTTAIPVDDTGLLLPAQARMALSGRSFTLLTVLAELDEEHDAELFASLLRHAADPDRTSGANYAIVTEELDEVLLAVHHWVLPTITADQFATLLRVFVTAVRGMRADLEDMIEAGAPLQLVTGPPG